MSQAKDDYCDHRLKKTEKYVRDLNFYHPNELHGKYNVDSPAYPHVLWILYL